MDNYNDVGYMNIPDDSECLVTAVHISKIIEEPPHTIRSWADEFEDFLYIKKINGRFSYTNKSIEQFEFIKKLRREKNFSIKQIKDQLKIKGFHYEDNENGLINTDDINLMESIKVDIGIEVKNQLKDFLNIFMEAQQLENANLLNSIKTDVEQTVQELLEESMSGIDKEIQLQKESNKILSQKLNDIQQELSITQDANKQLSQKLEEQSKQIQTNFTDMSKQIISENTKITSEIKNEFKCITLEQLSKSQEPKGLSAKISKLFHFKD